MDKLMGLCVGCSFLADMATILDVVQLRFIVNNSGCWAASTPQDMEMADAGTGC